MPANTGWHDIVTIDPSGPLKNKRHDVFAQRVANGMAGLPAYRLAYSPGDPAAMAQATARSNSHRLMLRDDVILRIAWLREQARVARSVTPEKLDRNSLLFLMGAATSAYRQAIAELELAGGSPHDVVMMRADLVQHVNRLHALAPAKESAAPPDGGQDIIADALVRLSTCNCAP